MSQVRESIILVPGALWCNIFGPRAPKFDGKEVMSLSNPNNPVFITEVQAPSTGSGMLDANENATRINQLHGIATTNATGAGIPKQVSNVKASVANAQTGSTCTVSVLFSQDPTDKNFAGVAVLVKGYQGNSQLVQVSSGASSPIKFVLNNTGETVSFTIQAYGNGGAAPITGSPTCSAVLPQSTGGGFGSSTVVSPPATTTPAVPCDHFYGGVGDGNFPPVGTSGRAGSNGGSSNVVGVVLFKLDAPITVNRVVINVSQNAGTGGKVAFGIYNASGNLLLQAQYTVPSGAATGSVEILVTGAPITLAAGNYFFANSADATANGGPFLVSTIAVDATQNHVLNGASVGGPRIATATNAMSAGSLPSTLGVLTALDLSVLRAIPLAVFYS